MLNQNKKNLGHFIVPALGLGCVNLSGLYGKPLIEAADILHFAFQQGVTLFDTADAYANGENETLIGDSLIQHGIPRDEVKLSTKCGVVWDKGSTLVNSVDNSPRHIKAACEASLKRLKTDYIDLYYLHRIASNGDAIEESMSAMQSLVEEGKILHVGLSEANSSIIRRAYNVHPLAAIQSEYSLMTRDPEINGVLDVCRELGIGFVAYSPLCRGLLSSHFNHDNLEANDFRHKFPRFKKGNIENNMLIVKQLEEMANEKNCSVVQLSLAWVSAQGIDILPIPGTKCIKHLQENIDASHVLLNEADLIALDKLFALGVASGERYSPAILRTFNLSGDAT
jgi:aryl-alcohol dehydrogenase-like predicted oxidoreductase